MHSFASPVDSGASAKIHFFCTARREKSEGPKIPRLAMRRAGESEILLKISWRDLKPVEVSRLLPLEAIGPTHWWVMDDTPLCNRSPDPGKQDSMPELKFRLKT